MYCSHFKQSHHKHWWYGDSVSFAAMAPLIVNEGFGDKCEIYTKRQISLKLSELSIQDLEDVKLM